MPVSTQTFQLYTSLGDPSPCVTIQVPSSAMADLEDAIRKGGWWCDPANPNDQRNFAGISRYVVSAP
jgi:hypothetical protein